jgi:hypothetical protein
LVYGYGGVAGDDFQVYYWQQAPEYVVPQTDDGARFAGAPEAGLTNAQAWAEYGIAIAGAVAPATAQPRDGIDGLVGPI